LNYRAKIKDTKNMNKKRERKGKNQTNKQRIFEEFKGSEKHEKVKSYSYAITTCETLLLCLVKLVPDVI